MNRDATDLGRGVIADEVVDARWKGFPALPAGTTVSSFVARRPPLFDAGFTWPVMVLRDSAIENNVTVLARWCEAKGISLAPHGKTTMAPALFARQLAAGAWGMTAATPWQVRMYRSWGVRRVFMANELVDVGFVGWLRRELTDPAFEFICYVDSIAGVHRLAEAMDGSEQALKVVVELGVAGGRTGVRDQAQAREVAEAVAKEPGLALVGVSGYEAPFGHGRGEGTLAGVRGFVLRLADLLQSLDGDGLLDARAGEYVLSCGGSGHIDVVSEVLAAPPSCSRPVRSLLRSGSYISHDNGLYARTSAFAASLRPAIEVWCQVWSRPEPGLALLGAGRRDLSFDAGMPVARWRRDAVKGELSPLAAQVSSLNDQHAFLDLDDSVALEVGDLVCLGVSHPCTTHDKWQLVPVVDDNRCVIDCVRCYF